MQSINKISDQIPGLLNLYCIPIYNVSYISQGKTYIINPYHVYKFIFALDSLKLNSITINSEKGDHYNHQLNCFVPGEGTPENRVLAFLRRYTLLTIFQEADGTHRRLGNHATGLRLTYDYQSGNREEFSKGYSIQLSGLLLNTQQPCENYLMHQSTQIPLT